MRGQGMKKVFLVLGLAFLVSGCCQPRVYYKASRMPKLDVRHIPFDTRMKFPVKILPIPDLSKQEINIIPL